MGLTCVSCVVCDAELKQVHYGSVNQPYDGLAFGTSGAYGTTAFDPMDGSYIEVNLCDECLMKAKEKRQVVHYDPHRRATIWGDE